MGFRFQLKEVYNVFSLHSDATLHRRSKWVCMRNWHKIITCYNLGKNSSISLCLVFLSVNRLEIERENSPLYTLSFPSARREVSWSGPMSWFHSFVPLESPWQKTNDIFAWEFEYIETSQTAVSLGDLADKYIIHCIFHVRCIACTLSCILSNKVWSWVLLILWRPLLRSISLFYRIPYHVGLEMWRDILIQWLIPTWWWLSVPSMEDTDCTIKGNWNLCVCCIHWLTKCSLL